VIGLSSNLEDLSKEPVFYYFKEISKIPRIPGEEEQISNYLVNFAKERNLEVIQDGLLNVIIKKPATKGYEQEATVIIQGHMDMVCEKTKDSKHDFRKDPLQLRVEGDMLYATDTTLGADNGVAVAYALALLDATDISHPNLEVVITTEEETSMGGALAVEGKHFNGTFLINIDHGKDHKLLVSGAGGIQAEQRVPVVEETPLPNYSSYKVHINGLKGGHSGIDIDKGLGNSIKMMGRFLHAAREEVAFYMYDIHGGFASNAIPRDAEVKLILLDDDITKFEHLIETWNAIWQNEFGTSDPDIQLHTEKLSDVPQTVFSEETNQKVISSLLLIPNGIQTISMDLDGLVESSTNLGVVTTVDKEVVLESGVRSSVDSLKQDIVNRSKVVADILDCPFKSGFSYPAWAYKKDSKLRRLFEKVHKEKFGFAPEIEAVHAGIECGVFLDKIADLDAISFGPDMHHIHSPDEHLNIPSTIRNWEYLCDVLEKVSFLRDES
jgi:dipeptidase D